MWKILSGDLYCVYISESLIMKSLIAAILFGLIAFSGCENAEKPVILPDLNLSFEIEQSNSDKDFTAQTAGILNVQKRAAWRNFSGDSVMLIREISLDMLLSNGDTIAFGLWMIKYDNADLVSLEGEASEDIWNRNWDYKEFETEARNFYQGFKEARVLVNNNVIWHNASGDEFRFEKIEKIMTGGKFRSYVRLRFSGRAHGWYDPSGEFQEVYLISDGILTGVLESV